MVTHEQAFWIRACETFYILAISGTHTKWKELEDLGLVQDDPGNPKPNNVRVPTDAGREALAEYDKRWQPVDMALIAGMIGALSYATCSGQANDLKDAAELALTRLQKIRQDHVH